MTDVKVVFWQGLASMSRVCRRCTERAPFAVEVYRSLPASWRILPVGGNESPYQETMTCGCRSPDGLSDLAGKPRAAPAAGGQPGESRGFPHADRMPAAPDDAGGAEGRRERGWGGYAVSRLACPERLPVGRELAMTEGRLHEAAV